MMWPFKRKTKYDSLVDLPGLDEACSDMSAVVDTRPRAPTFRHCANCGAWRPNRESHVGPRTRVIELGECERFPVRDNRIKRRTFGCWESVGTEYKEEALMSSYSRIFATIGLVLGLVGIIIGMVMMSSCHNCKSKGESCINDEPGSCCSGLECYMVNRWEAQCQPLITGYLTQSQPYVTDAAISTDDGTEP